MVEARVKAVVAKKYKFNQEIGKGSFGTVYSAYDIKGKRSVALKVGSLLNVSQREISIMYYLSGRSGFPQLYHSGRVYDTRYIAMQLLGDNVCDSVKACKKGLTNVEISVIMIKILKRLSLRARAMKLSFSHQQGLLILQHTL
mmetsp:Transcript_37/g.49  ORF Transcript_37/g.49 Transcript_37/m.49 type:complete len:143 (-) Transcript_37:469-897(-)